MLKSKWGEINSLLFFFAKQASKIAKQSFLFSPQNFLYFCNPAIQQGCRLNTD